MSVAVRPLLPAAGVAAAVGGALAVRVAVAGGDGAASSVPGAAVFALLLVAVAAAGRARAIAPLRNHGVAHATLIGVAGGVALVACAAVLRPAPLQLWARPGGAAAVWWTLLVCGVAAAEEVVFRGVLFDAVARVRGVTWAACVCALAFALVHVPLYGWRALPLDLGAGLWLGGLRVLSGGVLAPAVAHALADCGAWLVV